MDHRDTTQLNCRNFHCANNENGKCKLEKITIAPTGGLIDRVICIEAEEKEDAR